MFVTWLLMTCEWCPYYLGKISQPSSLWLCLEETLPAMASSYPGVGPRERNWECLTCVTLCLWCRVKGVMADQEKSLLQQLTEITRVMQEGQLMEGMTPEKKAQDNWEGTWTQHTPSCYVIMVMYISIRIILLFWVWWQRSSWTPQQEEVSHCLKPQYHSMINSVFTLSWNQYNVFWNSLPLEALS